MSRIHLYCNFVICTSLIYILAGTTAIAGDYGAVTAIAVSTSSSGAFVDPSGLRLQPPNNAVSTAFVGYSSGAVALCVKGSPCQAYTGTPDSPVTALDTDKVGNFVRVWVGYKNGDVYFCVTGECKLQTEGLDVTGKSNRIKVPQPVYLKQPK